jgi:hypothetical protein
MCGSRMTDTRIIVKSNFINVFLFVLKEKYNTTAKSEKEKK